VSKSGYFHAKIAECLAFWSQAPAGGVGGIGRAVVGLLRQRDVPVRALVHRQDERAEALRALGAEVIVGESLASTRRRGRA
jgi:NADPH:quinone reductase-like Zn-dependent oxidoreductase